MPHGGRLLVRPVFGREQPQFLRDGIGPEVEDLARSEHVLQRGVFDAVLGRAVGVHEETDGFFHADGVGDLYLAPCGQSGRHDVLRGIARVVRRRTIDFRGVLARKRTAAVRGEPAVGVDDDLAPGKPRIAARTAHDELARRVHVEPRAGCHKARRLEEIARDLLQHGVAGGRRALLGRLVRKNDRLEFDGHALLVDHGQLALGVRP